MILILALCLISLIIHSFLFSLDREESTFLFYENEENRTYFEEAIA